MHAQNINNTTMRITPQGKTGSQLFENFSTFHGMLHVENV